MSLVITSRFAADNSCDQCDTETVTQILLVKSPREWMIRGLCEDDFLAFQKIAIEAEQKTKIFPISEIEKAHDFMEIESPYYAKTRFKER